MGPWVIREEAGAGLAPFRRMPAPRLIEAALRRAENRAIVRVHECAMARV